MGQAAELTEGPDTDGCPLTADPPFLRVLHALPVEDLHISREPSLSEGHVSARKPPRRSEEPRVALGRAEAAKPPSSPGAPHARKYVSRMKNVSRSA
jgi:hypothetical protein